LTEESVKKADAYESQLFAQNAEEKGECAGVYWLPLSKSTDVIGKTKLESRRT
jgi:hypothetical protein